MWSTIGCTVIGQTWKTYLQNLHISRRFYWNRILWRHLLLERKRRKSEDSGLWKEINKSIAGLKKFPVRVQTIVYIIYIVCIVWDQRGSKCNINNDSVSKELQPETPGNVNGHDETPVSYPANRVVDVDKNQCWAIETKSILIWIPIFFPDISHMFTRGGSTLQPGPLGARGRHCGGALCIGAMVDPMVKPIETMIWLGPNYDTIIIYNYNL